MGITVCSLLWVMLDFVHQPYGPLGLFEGVLGTLESRCRVYSRYLGIPGLRAHTRGPWFQPLIGV